MDRNRWGGINVFDKGKRVAVYKEETGDLTDNSIQAALCDSEETFGLDRLWEEWIL